MRIWAVAGAMILTMVGTMPASAQADFEREVLRRIVTGQSTEEMAHAMRVSRSTARTHVQNVLQKLGVHSRLQAMAAVSRHPRGLGWLTGEDQELRHTQ